jgi:hypothetical protein
MVAEVTDKRINQKATKKDRGCPMFTEEELKKIFHEERLLPAETDHQEYWRAGPSSLMGAYRGKKTRRLACFESAAC